MIYKERYQQLLDKMNQYNSGEKGITRVAYTNEEQACLHALFVYVKMKIFKFILTIVVILLLEEKAVCQDCSLLSWAPI